MCEYCPIVCHIRPGMRRVSMNWCLPLSASTTKRCRAKPQKGATHRTKQRHMVLWQQAEHLQISFPQDVMHCQKFTQVHGEPGKVHRNQPKIAVNWDTLSSSWMSWIGWRKHHSIHTLFLLLLRHPPLAIAGGEDTEPREPGVWAGVTISAFLSLLKNMAKLWLVLTILVLNPFNLLRKAKFIKQATKFGMQLTRQSQLSSS